MNTTLSRSVSSAVLLWCCCQTTFHGQTSPDSATVMLREAAVAAYSPLLSPEQIAATLWAPDSMLVEGFGSVDLAPALNALPGVLMETRGAGGSRRLNVRGSALRSPFAVRNTMLFVRGFLMTEADGTSPMEWLEPSWTGPISLVSGAAATTFGGAYGGALVVEGSGQATRVGGHLVTGPTGSEGMQSRVNVTVPIGAWQVRASRSQNSGYREHEWNERWQLEVEHMLDTEKAVHRNWWAFQDGSWALPGAIKLNDEATLAPGLAYDAHVQRRRALWGHHAHVANWRNRPHRRSLDVWALARWTDKINPFGTSPFFNGYKEESGWGGSLRIRERFTAWEGKNTEIQAEWNFMSTFDDGAFARWESATERKNSDLLYDLNVRQTRTHWAPSMAFAWSNGMRLEASTALSIRTRSATGVAMNEPYDAPFEAWDVLPRIGLSKTLGDWGNWFFQTSTGFSDPTNFESLSTDVEGALLNPLRAEEALTFETGLRFEQAECVFYHQTVGNAIVQVIENDIESFINETNPLTMVGLEGAWNQRFKRHSVRLTGALQMHVRDSGWPPVSFTDGGLLWETDVQRLPGSPHWTANAMYTWQVWQREHHWNLHAWIRGVGATPLTDDGEVLHPAYAVGNVEASWCAPNQKTCLNMGVRNVTNTSYSGWHQLNGVFGKLYNPAPPRTWFLSATWSL
ncbi:MAG: TonB-dependent receptor [Bacteroidota bacterium]|nr:TonB-dependent receptor [Bacteroidota bacterium]